MRIIGTTTTVLTDGATTNPIVIDGNDYTAVAGDVVLYGNITGEYLFNGTVWRLLGTGSSSSPFIVYCWDDFLKVNNSSYSVKFANPHEVDGQIILEGSGSQSNPYIVSTYEEMLFATGASAIWKVKLVNRDRKLYQYRYIVDYAQPNEPIYADVFCLYDDSHSTIDFNDIQPEGFADRLYFIAGRIDFNGWTFLNIIIKYDMVFNNTVDNAYTNGRFINLVLRSSNNYAIGCQKPSYVTGCIFDITVGANINSIFQQLPSNSAITIHAKDGIGCKLSYSAAQWVQNTVINLDVSCDWLFGDVSFDNCLITGNCETTRNNAQLGQYVRYSVYNFDSTFAWNRPPYVQGVTLINTTKAPNVTSSVALFKLVPDEDMRSAQVLYDLGLPIGVD